MAVRFQLRRDTAANWTSVNPVLALGEPGVETDTLRVKIGDGVNAWSSLSYTITTQFGDLTGVPTTLAGYGITDAATSAQGALADTAVQPGDVFVGDLKGSVFGDDSTVIVDAINNTLAGDLTGNVTGNLTGNVTGNVSGNVTGNVTGQVSDISNHDTDALSEGTTNKYFATSLVDNHLSGGTGVDYTTGTISIGQAVATTDSVEFVNIKATGYIEGPASFTIDPAAVGDNTGTVIIAGNLQVDGTTTTINSTTLEVEDKNIVLGPNAANDAANNGAGLTVTQPDTTNATILWDTTNAEWDLSNGLNVAGTIKSSGQFTSDTGDASFRRAGSTTARIRIESGTTYSDQNFTVNATQATVDASDPILLLSANANRNSHVYFGDPDADNIGRVSYDHAQDRLQIWVNGANAIEINSTQDITTTGKLHLADGDAGTVTAANSANNLVVEGAGATGMSLLHGTTAATAYSNIYIGNETDGEDDFRMTYFGSDYLLAGDRQNFVMRTAGTEALRVDENQDTTLAGALNLNGASQNTILNVYSGSDDNLARFTSGDANARIQIDDTDTTNIPYVGVTGNNISLGHTTGGDAFTVTSDGDATLTGNHTAADYILEAIDATIADTATALFGYSTSNDSDGGAWRKRVQHTSWYNETLSTSTRGSRREFPASILIVAETGKVTIYDADDPSMPMWMVFNGDSNANWNGTSSNKTSVKFKNGILYVGTATGGIRAINFVKDIMDVYYTSTGDFSPIGGIVTRNDAVNWGAGPAVSTMSSSNVYSLAVDVLPNATIDSISKLPIPTVGAGVSNGLNVIKDDYTVSTSDHSGPVYDMYFTDSHTLVVQGSTNEVNPYRWPDYLSDGFVRDYRYYGTTVPSIPTETDRSIAVLKNNVIAHGSNNYLALIAEDLSSQANGMACYIDSDYNTGWMPGDIKLAALSDTNDTDLSISDLVINGTFDTDTVGWTATNASLASVSGELEITPDPAVNGYASQSFSTAIGATYIATVTVTSSASSFARLWIGTTATGGEIDQSTVNNVGPGDYSIQFVATSTTTYISALVGGGTSEVTRFDNISVRSVEFDRSVNNNALQVFGNITKDPVDTGADLVAYSGFSSSNYLQQPYNSDLDFGTGAFSIMAWFRTTSQSADQYIVDRSTDGTPRFLLLVRGTSGGSPNAFQFYVADSSGNASDVVATDLPAVTNTWSQVCAVFDGTTYKIFVNGVQSSVTNTNVRDIANDGSPLKVGVRFNNTANWAGDLALLRISTTAPSAEQIAKIYEDEKVLFYPNAQATLYGTSDAITALAYDDSTELLHAGTSQGRSVFQGLRRVDNTTDAVGAAISASNGMVAED
jgi:hypothetical protein